MNKQLKNEVSAGILHGTDKKRWPAFLPEASIHVMRRDSSVSGTCGNVVRHAFTRMYFFSSDH
ncbi:MAG: hypothetical protein LBR86_03290, partial [Tannerella sp.]|nr:hypothetical protein [Tannerella sp.]